ncbi:MAG: tRNA uridine-5-carboxymethylaminomethyl(34) synthesis enzyme MnmG, partial [Ignavibacteriaceae bacterium]|nr:tRNA uridine-5-carboxymethylaminomethyl(34) synthesis enzyme MnmG [Ignavibacteriaceae bacterium]
LVHEIDALGGVMGQIADKTGIQFRILNKSKGPAVWAGRCQSDRKLYSEVAGSVVRSTINLAVVEDSVVEAVQENNKIVGIITGEGEEVNCKALVVCSGTFLNGLMHTGMSSIKGGRFGEAPSLGLSASFEKMGFVSGRLKTGTPPRLNKNTIDFSVLEEQPGDKNPEPFSLRTPKELFPFLPQVSCHITYTDNNVHKILEKGFDKSPLFRGLIDGVGPRYCPSIEDKVVRFSDKEKHQLFLEPEGLYSDQIYLNGFATSLPEEIQLEALHKIKGLEEVEMVRPGYAVEYDFFPPHQVDSTLETKLVKGLYFAGQVNGTSGYEEAAAQGLIAGINAALKLQEKKEFVLKRSEAYIGVLIDDLVTKSTDEPYRMFTSRAEHRLLLRQDNADRRLMKYGKEFCLIPPEHFEKVEIREQKIVSSTNACRKLKFQAKDINYFLDSKSSSRIDSSETVANLCRRPELSLKELLNLNGFSDLEEIRLLLEDEVALKQVEIDLKYEGYLKRQEEMIAKLERYEDSKIPLTLNYFNLKALSTESREKLQKYKPRSIGQASRIQGVTPSDISVLLVYLKK